MLDRRIALALMSATTLTTAACSEQPVETTFENARGIATRDDSGGIHADLLAPDDALLASLDIGSDGATWQDATGVLKRIEVVPDLDWVPDAIPENTTRVARLPDDLGLANEMLHDLYQAEQGAWSEAEVTDERETAYLSCEVYWWDNMMCIRCLSGCDNSCLWFHCVDYIGGGVYDGGNFCEVPPGGMCV